MKLMTGFLLAFGLSTALSASPLNGTVCKGQKTSWEKVSHVGGAGPGPNSLLSHTKLSIDGEVVEHLEYYASKPDPQPVYSVTFDEQSTTILEKTGNPTSGSVTYLVSIIVEKNNGGIDPIEERVKCVRTWAMLP